MSLWERPWSVALRDFTPRERRRLLTLQQRIHQGDFGDDRDDTPLLRRLRFYRWLFITGRLRDDLPACAPHEGE